MPTDTMNSASSSAAKARNEATPWSADRAAIGIWIKLPVPEVLEVVLHTGVDFVVLDCEHGPFGPREMSTMVAVGRGLGLPVFVRVAGIAAADVQPALDAGADGLFVPHVDDPAVARRVVDACRFPPLGNRPGSPTTRAGDWGRTTPAGYVARGNAHVLLIAQIESPAAVASARAIAQTDGLDAVFIGPFDLALSSGVEANDPRLQAMISGVEESVRGHALGGVASTAAAASDMTRRGYAFLMVGADTTFLADAVERSVRHTRAATTTTSEGT